MKEPAEHVILPLYIASVQLPQKASVLVRYLNRKNNSAEANTDGFRVIAVVKKSIHKSIPHIHVSESDGNI